MTWLFCIIHLLLKDHIFHFIKMKDKVTQLTASRKQLLQQMPDLSTVLPGSLLSRMVRCNKPGCRFCEKGKGKGHGPIWILSVSLGNRQVRQIPVPSEMKKEVEESLRAFAQTAECTQADRAGESGVVQGTEAPAAVRSFFCAPCLSFLKDER